MIRRIWTKTDTNNTGRTFLRYDFGDFEGWLDGDLWKCWRIISTESVGETVVQVLQPMPEDYCPFKTYSIEHVRLEEGPNRLQMDGWSIRNEPQAPMAHH